MTNTRYMSKYYFQVVSVLLLVLSFIAFSDNLITNIGQESNRDPKFIVHGVLMFAWFGILVVQAGFIRKGDYQAHMRWGITGMLVAIGVFLSTVYIFIAVYEGWDAMPSFVKQNRIYMLSFAVLVLLGYRYRKDAIRHKRFIYVGTLLILEPILSRVTSNLHIAEIFIDIIWNGLFVSLMVYDWLTLQRVHIITWMGFVWFYVVLGFSLLV